MDQSNNVKVKRLAKGTRLVVVTAVILAVLILLNVGVSLLPRAWSNFVADSSDAFSISATSKSFFKNLDTDVTIYYVLDPDMTYDYQCAAKFRVMLDRYARLNDHINVVYVDVDDTEFLSKYTSVMLIGSSVIVEGPERYDVISYDELFKYAFPDDDVILSYNDLYTVYNGWVSVAENYSQTYGQEAAIAYADQAVAQYYKINNFYSVYTEILEGNHRHWYADAMLTASVDYVTTEDIPTTYILSGHGEAELSENFTKMYLDDLSIRYFLWDLDAKGSIPENAVTLVLNDPKTDITAAEKTLLADFLADGGSLILNTTPGAADLPNLMSLLGTYGLGATNAIVLDDSLHYDPNADEGESTTDKETEKETEAETEADAQAQAEESTEAESEKESSTEAETYPDDYLYLLPDSKHELVATADEIIHMAMLSEIYSRYMAARQQYEQTGDSMYQEYAQYYQQRYEYCSQNAKNNQMLIIGAHPITVTETAGVTVKPIATTSKEGYLSTDPTAAVYNMAVSATVTTGDKTGSIVWFGFADSYNEKIAEELCPYNYGFLYAAVDYSGSTQVFKSDYASIPAIDLGGTLDMHWSILIGIAAFSIILLPLGTVVTGIVVCVRRKRK